MIRSGLVLTVTLAAACSTQDGNLGNTHSPVTPGEATPLGATRWALSFGGPDNDVAASIALDSQGDAVVAAGFMSSATAGSATFGADGGAIVTKRAAGDGGERWTRSYATANGAAASPDAIAIDGADNIYIAGGFGGQPSGVGTFDFGGVTLSALAGEFVEKLGPDGSLQWVVSLGSDSLSGESHIAVGSDGARVYVTGAFRGEFDFPNATYVSSGIDSIRSDLFVAALDGSDGAVRWGTAMMTVDPGGSDDGMIAPGGIALLPDGDVVIAGTLAGSATLGGVPLAAGQSPFAARFSPDGDVAWRELLDASAIAGTGIAARPDGTLVAACALPGLQQEGWPELVDIAGDGSVQWTSAASAGGGNVTALALDESGTAIMTGYNDLDALEFGSARLPAGLYFAGFDDTGAYLDARAYDPNPIHGGGVLSAISSRGGASAIAGAIDDATDFGTGSLPFAGAVDAAVIYLSPPQ